MSCDWTEKVSLLVDGELAPRETRLTEAHVASCAACRRTREDFLALRERVGSIPYSTDAHATRRALEKVLAASADTQGGRAFHAKRPESRARLSWGLPRMSPALASAFALVALAAALGVVWSLVGRVNGPTQVVQNSPRVAEGVQAAKDENVAPKASDAVVEQAKPEGTQSAVVSSRAAVVTVVVRRAASLPRRTRGASPDEITVSASASSEATRGRSRSDALAEFAPVFDAAEDARYAPEEPRVEAPAGETERHFEQAQVLLRSFRNARPAAVADERQRSQKLLYRNIVLRREAARTGDRFAERALDTLEPILIDIANLPERPKAEEVAEVVERMRRKNIVAVLQANIAAAPRAY